MPGSQAPSLKEFVAASSWRGGSTSWCCHAIPPELLAEIEAYVAECRERNSPPHWRAVVDWLRGHGLADASTTKVRYHFEREHDRR